MDASTALIILGEAAIGGFVIWGFLHEDRFVAFEKKAWKKLKGFFQRLKRKA